MGGFSTYYTDAAGNVQIGALPPAPDDTQSAIDAYAGSTGFTPDAVSGDSTLSNPTSGSGFNLGSFLNLAGSIAGDVSSVIRTINTPTVVPYGTTVLPGVKTPTGQTVYTSPPPPTAAQQLVKSGSLNYLILGGVALVVLVLVLALKK